MNRSDAQKTRPTAPVSMAGASGGVWDVVPQDWHYIVLCFVTKSQNVEK